MVNPLERRKYLKSFCVCARVFFFYQNRQLSKLDELAKKEKRSVQVMDLKISSHNSFENNGHFFML